MEYYDYDPKYGEGDGNIEFRAIGSKTTGSIIVKTAGAFVELVPYTGTEQPINLAQSHQTFSIDSEWHNRPA